MYTNKVYLNQPNRTLWGEEKCFDAATMVATGPPGAALLPVFTFPPKMDTNKDLTVEHNELLFSPLLTILLLQFKLSSRSSGAEVFTIKFVSEIDDKRFFNVEKAESTHTSYWSRIGCAKCMIIVANWFLWIEFICLL